MLFVARFCICVPSPGLPKNLSPSSRSLILGVGKSGAGTQSSHPNTWGRMLGAIRAVRRRDPA